MFVLLLLRLTRLAARWGRQRGRSCFLLNFCRVGAENRGHAATAPNCSRWVGYHVLNRRVARLALFENAGDEEAFERVLAEAVNEHSTRVRPAEKGAGAECVSQKRAASPLSPPAAGMDVAKACRDARAGSIKYRSTWRGVRHSCCKVELPSGNIRRR